MSEDASRPRSDAVDIARGLSLLAMAAYHFVWDLTAFSFVPPARAVHAADAFRVDGHRLALFSRSSAFRWRLPIRTAALGRVLPSGSA